VSKKYQNRLKELQRIRAQHSDEQIGVKTVAASNEIEGVAPLVPSGSQASDHVPARLLRRDFGGLFLVSGLLVAALLGIYWATVSTNIDDRLIAFMQRVF
jgi:hypothetical protein